MEFKYIATEKKSGQRVTAFATATSVSALVMRLKEDGLVPLRVFEAKQSKANRYFRFAVKRVKLKEITVFTRQLAAMLSAGLLLTEALDAIAEDLENEYFAGVIEKIKQDIQGGSDLSGALVKFPKIFNVTYTSIVKSG